MSTSSDHNELARLGSAAAYSASFLDIRRAGLYNAVSTYVATDRTAVLDLPPKSESD